MSEYKVLSHYVKDKLTEEVFDLDLLNMDELKSIQDAGNFNEDEYAMIGARMATETVRMQKEAEFLNGIVADEMKAKDLATMHDVSVDEIKKEIEMGKKVESEHTGDKDMVSEIVMDHLFEIPDYYTRLENMEEEAKSEIEEDYKERTSHTKYVMTREAWTEIGETAGWIEDEAPKEITQPKSTKTKDSWYERIAQGKPFKPQAPRMMPGQTPYTPEELAKLNSLVGDAAMDDPGEEREDSEPQFVYLVVDSDFNRANYPDLIGYQLEEPPTYAQVEKVEKV